MSATHDHLVFIGLSGKLVALDRDTGQPAWEYNLKAMGGYVTLALDGDRLLAVASGYVTCLDAGTGRVRWHNPLRGKGLGIASIVTARSPMDQSAGQAAVATAAAAGAGS